MKCYTHHQIYSFLDQIPEEYQLLKDIFEVLYLTGMRVNELLALTYSAIDFQKKKKYPFIKMQFMESIKILVNMNLVYLLQKQAHQSE